MRLIGLFVVIAAMQLNCTSKYVLTCRKDLLTVSRKICIEQVGTLEQGENRGIKIERYLAAVNLPAGYPYCAAGQYWCFAAACRRLNICEKNIPVPRTGLANVMFNYAKKTGIAVKYSPVIDDLLVWRRGKSSFGHIERIISTAKAGWVYTVGFNTVKVTGNKKHEGVFLHKRNIYHFLGRMHIRGIIGFVHGGSDDT